MGRLPRSEVEVTADAVWQLMQRRVLKGDNPTLRAACTALGISVDDVRLASIRAERRGYPKPSRDGEVVHEDLRLRRGPASLSPQKRRSQIAAHPGEHWCCRCRKWLPEDQFGIKNHRTGRLNSMCRDCKSEYQRERYLSVKKAGHLAELRFRLAEGDATVGDSCSVCREILKVGDEVMARGAVVHAGCGDGTMP